MAKIYQAFVSTLSRSVNAKAAQSTDKGSLILNSVVVTTDAVLVPGHKHQQKEIAPWMAWIANTYQLHVRGQASSHALHLL